MADQIARNFLAEEKSILWGVDSNLRCGRPYVRGVKVARPLGKLKSGVASDGPEPSPKLKRGRTMEQHSEIFIGLDTSKLKISVAVANGERNGEVRFYGDISSDPRSVRSTSRRCRTPNLRGVPDTETLRTASPKWTPMSASWSMRSRNWE